MKGWENSKVFLVGQFGQLVSIHQKRKSRGLAPELDSVQWP